MYVELGDKLYKVIVNKKKIKNMYFKWNRDEIIVSCNKYMSDSEIKRVILKNESSLLKLKSRTPVSTLKEDEMYFLGDKYKIEFDGFSKTHIESNCIIAKDRSELDKFMKNECVKVFNQRLELIKPEFDNLPKFTLKIRKMSTRWGVCNTGSMSVTLNSELIKKDVTLIDYVIIHELCHFKHMNHSKDFWDEVEKYYPYHKRARKMLRESQND